MLFQNLKARWWRLPQQVRFFIAGGYNTAFGYLAFLVLYLAGRQILHYLVIAIVANVIATLSAFVVHRNMVFQSVSAWAPEFLRFYSSQLVSVAVGTALLYALVQGLGVSPLSAQAVVTVLSVLVSYGLHHYFTFAKHRSGI